MIGVKLKGKKEFSIKRPLEAFPPVPYVYIPVENSEILVDKKQSVLLGEKIAKKENGLFLFSSVSGKVVGTVKMKNALNQDVKCIKIKNDYFESAENREVTVGYKVQHGQVADKIVVTFNGSDNPDAQPKYAIRVVVMDSEENVKACKIDDTGATQLTWT